MCETHGIKIAAATRDDLQELQDFFHEMDPDSYVLELHPNLKKALKIKRRLEIAELFGLISRKESDRLRGKKRIRLACDYARKQKRAGHYSKFGRIVEFQRMISGTSLKRVLEGLKWTPKRYREVLTRGRIKRSDLNWIKHRMFPISMYDLLESSIETFEEKENLDNQWRDEILDEEYCKAALGMHDGMDPWLPNGECHSCGRFTDPINNGRCAACGYEPVTEPD